MQNLTYFFQYSPFTQDQLRTDSFASWLCQRKKELAGYGGSRFSSPLVEWLSTLVGYQCTVEDSSYGWMLPGGQWLWRPLPTWGLRFQRKMEAYTIRPMTGDEALNILADLELAG